MPKIEKWKTVEVYLWVLECVYFGYSTFRFSSNHFVFASTAFICFHFMIIRENMRIPFATWIKAIKSNANRSNFNNHQKVVYWIALCNKSNKNNNFYFLNQFDCVFPTSSVFQRKGERKIETIATLQYNMRWQNRRFKTCK